MSTAGSRFSADAVTALFAGWLTLAWAIQDLTDHWPERHWWDPPIFAAASVGVALTLTGRRSGPWLLLVAGVLAGVAEHLWRPSVMQSDVLPTIQEAFRQMVLFGRDPYAIPAPQLPGGPYLYPPGPFFIYGPALVLTTDLTQVERLAGIATILVLATTARWTGPGRAGLAATMYGTYLFGTFRTLDSGNDTMLALLFMIGIMLLMRGEIDDRIGRVAFWASAPVLALGVLLKGLAWPLYAFIALYQLSTRRGRRHVGVTLLLVALPIIPFALRDPEILVRMTLVVGNKPTIYGMNLLGGLFMVSRDLAAAIQPAAVWMQLGAAVAVGSVCLWRGSGTLWDAVAGSLAVTLTLLILSNWTSPAYYMFLGSILCLGIAVAGVRDHRAVTARGVGISDGLRAIRGSFGLAKHALTRRP